MNSRTFLSTIEAEGVRLRRDADELKIQTRRGVSSDAYIDLIRLNKASLLATLAEERHDIPWITPDDLNWVPVFQGEVDETLPPEDWDRILPADCAWPHLCTVLGPCPHASEGRCHRQSHQPIRAVAESSDARETAVA
jgi:hypothetical protein